MVDDDPGSLVYDPERIDLAVTRSAAAGSRPAAI
jgi:hypothetical protein